MTTANAGMRLTIGAAVAYTVLLAAVALLARRWPRLVSLPTGAALLVLGYMTIGGAEMVREAIRKPWLIGSGGAGYMYANGFTPEEARATRTSGLLASARWAAPGVGGSTSDPRVEGKEVFRLACQSCHSVDHGRRNIRHFVDGKPLVSIASAISRLEKLRGGMPPFPGNEHDAQSLATYLASLDGVEEPPPTAAPAGDVVARGRQVMEKKCLVCHEEAPLRSRVRGWTEKQAFETLGRLPSLNDAMPDFDGTEEERRALASFLSQSGNIL